MITSLPSRDALIAQARGVDVTWVACVGVALLVAFPLIGVAGLAMAPDDGMWSHLWSSVLGHYVTTTLLLMLGVGVGVGGIGVSTAWLVSMCRFPGSAWLEWALLLPMAMPAYIIAYVYTDVLEYGGPVQGVLRATFGWSTGADYWFPEIRSLGGAMAMMSLVLYPYVYLLARAAFIEQSGRTLEASRTLGKGPWASFFRAALPMARPAIAVGIALALMEVINDFGTVDFFAVATLTAGIYDVWLNMNSISGAAQLAITLLVVTLALIWLERHSRRERRVDAPRGRFQSLPQYQLTGWRAGLACAVCVAPVVLGFVLPAAILTGYAVRVAPVTYGASLWAYAANSLMLASLAALIAVIAGVILAYGRRLHRGVVLNASVQLAGVGYAVPGAVLAVGVMFPLAAVDSALDAAASSLFGVSTGLILSGSVAALLIGFTARFTAISLGAATAGLQRITPSMDGAARTLGRGPKRTLLTVHLPMMKGSLLTAALLVFVDGMKELPMTTLLRPFNFETLATYVHQFASGDLLAESSHGALAIVVAGILPILLLSARIRGSRVGAGR